MKMFVGLLLAIAQAIHTTRTTVKPFANHQIFCIKSSARLTSVALLNVSQIIGSIIDIISHRHMKFDTKESSIHIRILDVEQKLIT